MKTKTDKDSLEITLETTHLGSGEALIGYSYRISASGSKIAHSDELQKAGRCAAGCAASPQRPGCSRTSRKRQYTISEGSTTAFSSDVMSLSRVSKIVVQFSPLSPDGRSVREFLVRISSGKAAASNPDCEVLTRIMRKGQPFCRIEYKDGRTDHFETADMKAEEIFERMKQAAEEMETQETMKKAGLDTAALTSEWGGSSSFAGKIQKIPTS